MSEAFKNIIFILQLLKMMGIKVKLRVIVFVGHARAILLEKNVATSSKTKNMGIHTMYVRECMKDRVINIYFVRSEDNNSDIMTKNIQGDIYDKHSSHLVMAIP